MWCPSWSFGVLALPTTMGMHMFDVDEVRLDFPFYTRDTNPRTYLDSAATSHKPQPVLDALESCYTTFNGSVHRSRHTLGDSATEKYEQARMKVATFIGTAIPEEVVFTKNATEALNLIANVLMWAAPPYRVGPGDRIVITEMEHASNMVPWQLLAERTGAELVYLGLTDDGRLDLSCLDQMITRGTRVVAVTHISNALGTVNPLSALIARAHQVGALVVVDACQSAPHRGLDVAASGADLVAFSGHKMCGPTGIGVLWGRRDVLAQLPPFLAGGHMNEQVTTTGTTFAPPPRRFEAGTPPVAEAVALGAAVDYLTDIGMAAIEYHDRELVSYALDRLATVDGLRVLGPHDPHDRGSLISFVVDGFDADVVGSLLDQNGIAVRTGRHCAHVVCARLGVPATVRASFYLYNGIDDVDALVTALQGLPGRLPVAIGHHGAGR